MAGVHQWGTEEHRDRRDEVGQGGRGAGGWRDRAERDECRWDDGGVRHRDDGGGERCGEDPGCRFGRGRIAAAYAGGADQGPCGCGAGGEYFSLWDVYGGTGEVLSGGTWRAGEGDLIRLIDEWMSFRIYEADAFASIASVEE